MSYPTLPGKQKEMYNLKQQAMKYYQENKVPAQMENVLNSMFYDKPPDIYGYLVNFFGQFSKPATLKKISALPVLDSNGQLTIQTDVYCIVNNLHKYICSSTIPRADIKLHLEEPSKAEMKIQASVEAAIRMINSEISNKLIGMDPAAQGGIDCMLLCSQGLLPKPYLLLDCYHQANGVWNLKCLFLDSYLPWLPSLSARDICSDHMNLQKEKESQTSTTTYKSSEKQGLLQVPPEDKQKRLPSKAKLGPTAASLPFVPDRPLENFVVGCEAVAAVSQALCIAAATSRNIPVYQHVATLASKEKILNEFGIPIPMVTILQSGKTVSGKLACVKEFLIVPGARVTVEKGIEHIRLIYQYIAKLFVAKYGPLAKLVNETGALCPILETVNQGLDILLEAVNAQGLVIGEDIHLAITAAAHECFDHDKGRYEVTTGQYKSPDEMVDFWIDVVQSYPSIVAIIDPIRGEDLEQWLELCEKISKSVFVIGDQFFERPGILKNTEHPVQTSGIVLHTERMNTISDIIECASTYQDLHCEVVISTNQGDTTDTFLVDLAVGLNASFLKLGGPCRGERTSKLNRLIQIFREMVPPPDNECCVRNVMGCDHRIDDATDGDQSSSMVVEPSVSKKEQVKCNSLDDWKRCHLKKQGPFIFPLIKKKSQQIVEEVEVAEEVVT